MHKRHRKYLATFLSIGLVACSATEPSSLPVDSNVQSSVKSETNLVSPDFSTSQSSLPVSGLTLKKIMADPDWIGRRPESPFWSLNGSTVLFSQKRQFTVVRDLFSYSISTGKTQSVELNELHEASVRNRVYNQQKTIAAWIFEGNLFAKQMSDGVVKQLTRDNQSITNITFLDDDRLSYQVQDAIYSIELTSGRTSLLVSWKFDEPVKAVEPSADYIAQEQLKLMQVLRDRRQRKIDTFRHQQDIQNNNASVSPRSFFMPTQHRTVEASISPNGKYALLAIEKDISSRDKSDIMPNYVVDNGRIEAQSVRRRVADAKPSTEFLWLLDLENGTKAPLSYNSLPGYNEDVLAAVKRENAKAKGEAYQENRLPRDIGLLVDWGWSQSAISWHNESNHVAVMLEAWDNKDRWLATVDLEDKKLITQHRLHDDAWINYNFNSFGWMTSSPTLYFLSEESGYSHIYKKPINGDVVALTQGKFEVDEITLSADDQFIYYQANQKHPGIYEVYRVNTNNGNVELLTDLNGMTDYVLSDDESSLLLTHSKLTQPPELFIKDVATSLPATQITFTTSEAFKEINWTAPEIVPIKSSNVEDPIYSRLYLPANHDTGKARRAVVFNHGAGYLQNSHLGWSGYFREFMFHNLLVQQGYVVLDMDYRASAGYGRDWRTAIYRHMGKPETEDLVDGVEWMVNNVNVDRSRVGTYGGSYGGFMTFMALFNEPDLFQAGAALRPVSDWAHYNHGYTSNILNTPEVDPIAYERSSPIYFAKGLTKPLLINAPMVDNNVFFVDVVRLVQRLIELEKQNFETAIYPVEAHGFIEPSSWLDEYRRIYKLFEENL